MGTFLQLHLHCLCILSVKTGKLQINHISSFSPPSFPFLSKSHLLLSIKSVLVYGSPKGLFLGLNNWYSKAIKKGKQQQVLIPFLYWGVSGTDPRTAAQEDYRRIARKERHQWPLLQCTENSLLLPNIMSVKIIFWHQCVKKNQLK